ncbi:hypothetical protein DFH09DRAFT_1312064 [Mycena vulgaris]|nr:hypothetical protein DFH09DRAFT_1312064 [Mycena vulgaris]
MAARHSTLPSFSLVITQAQFSSVYVSIHQAGPPIGSAPPGPVASPPAFTPAQPQPPSAPATHRLAAAIRRALTVLGERLRAARDP